MRPSDLCLEASRGELFLRDERHRGSFSTGRAFEPFPFTTHDPVSFDSHLRAGLKPLWPGVLGIAALTATGCTGKITRETTATLLALEGSVLIQGSAQGEASRAAQPRAQIRKGETVRTGSDASAALMLLPGALIQLGPDSALRIEKLALTKDGNALNNAMSRVVLLSLLEGTADLVVHPEPSRCQWNVETSNGRLASVRPGTCRLSVKQGLTRVTCLRGAFSFVGSDDVTAVEIEDGCFKEWPSERGDAQPVETDSRAQEDVDQALDVERNLLELQRRERFTPFPWRQL